MIIVRNEILIRQYKSLGTTSGILSILILLAGTYISFRYKELVLLAFIALLGGILFYQVSIYYTNRFVRSPRPDQELDAALKGFDDLYAIYHYQSPVSHLLVGPAGVWMLLPFHNKGKIIYSEEKERWKKIGGNLYQTLFNQDTIGKLDKRISKDLQKIQKELKKIPDLDIPEIQTALVFTNEEAVVEADNAPYPTLHARQLKKLIRKEAKGNNSLPTHVVKTIQDHLGLESKS